MVTKKTKPAVAVEAETDTGEAEAPAKATKPPRAGKRSKPGKEPTRAAKPQQITRITAVMPLKSLALKLLLRVLVKPNPECLKLIGMSSPAN